MNILKKEAQAIALETTALISSKSKLGDLNERDLTKEVTKILSPVNKVYLIASGKYTESIVTEKAATGIEGITKLLIEKCEEINCTVHEDSVIIDFDKGEIDFKYHDFDYAYSDIGKWYLLTVEII